MLNDNYHCSLSLCRGDFEKKDKLKATLFQKLKPKKVSISPDTETINFTMYIYTFSDTKVNYFFIKMQKGIKINK